MQRVAACWCVDAILRFNGRAPRCYLWSARHPGSGMLTASLKVLARLAGQGRSTVAEGIKRLAELGLISKIKRRVRVIWGGSVASRQIANAYVLRPESTESGKRTAEKKPQNILYEVMPPTTVQKAAAEALQSVTERRLRALWGSTHGKMSPGCR